MRRIAALVLALGLGPAFLAAPPAAQAQGQTQDRTQRQAQQSWLQIEAQPTLVKAEERARAWAARFPDVAGFRLTSGWYAIVLGPQTADEARRRLLALRAERAIPADSYLQDGGQFGARFWPAGAGALPAGATLESAAAEEVAPEPDTSLPDEEAPSVEDLLDDVADELAALTAEESAPPAPGDRGLPDENPDESLAEARSSEALLGAEERRELQEALAYEGVYTAGIDGAFGPGTRAAMTALQEAWGAPVTGVLTSRQRARVLGPYRAARDSLGLAEVVEPQAGISLHLPLALLGEPATQPPFVHYASRGDSGVQVLLLSQPGDAATLAALYQQVQTLDAVPLDGPRELGATGFTVQGADARQVAYAQAGLDSAGLIKGFVLVWPQEGDDKRRALALTSMQQSFRALPGAALPDPAREGVVQAVDLLAGLETRRPAIARTGFFIDATGRVVTSADVAEDQCRRLTIEGALPMQVLASDPALGLALIAPEEPLAPLAHAEWRHEPPRPGVQVTVAGYAWEGRLGAAVVSLGRLVEARGPDGDPDRQRLELAVTPGEAGAPVLDSNGAVLGMLLSPRTPGVAGLPEGVSLALSSARIEAFLAQATGLAVQDAAASSSPPSPETLSPEALAARARDMTVAVACWD